ncbi:MAG: isoprenyl transferase [Candidatus Omnitrophica bacterium]|nr:isoprenyl transferase [Candidatus Omnitrophota bacterium]
MINKNDIPKHIAIIMDGNGRWARARHLPRTAGHREGIERVRDIVKSCLELGVKVVTFFAFSTENWNRPRSEINVLMRFLGRYIDQEIEKLNNNNIKFKTIGRKDPLPKLVLKKLNDAEKKTGDNTAMTMVLALNYGARQEIVDAAKQFTAAVVEKKTDIEDLDVEGFKRYLYTRQLPDPDLLIRTSGEMRISNFLLWQLSYAELYFSKKYWPDFKRADLIQAIREYQMRERRFGKINVLKKSN